jgi:hypothetical protein
MEKRLQLKKWKGREKMNGCRTRKFLLLLFMGFYVFIFEPAGANDMAAPVVTMNYNIISGSWQRTDGGYLIAVGDVLPDGQTRVEYFNPRPIHVARAAVATRENMIELFIQFQDKGYEGSTYRLYYYAQEDALVGFYHQAPTNKTYEVIFLRKIK